MRREIPCGGDERLPAAACSRVVGGGLESLDAVKVPVFAQEQPRQSRDQSLGRSAACQVLRRDFGGRLDLVPLIEQRSEISQQALRFRGGSPILRQPRRGDIEK